MGVPWARRWHCRMGRFRVPEWLLPMRAHRLADNLGGVG